MKKLTIVILFLVFAGLINACSDEEINPTEEGGSTQESTEQWEDN
jgi:PBP1b-binding outer membrane lipoprotein LpoB